MTATGQMLLKHPCIEEINQRLLSGESLEAVDAWLSQKYSSFTPERRKKLCPNKQTLQAYRRNFLNLDKEMISDLRFEKSKRLMQERQDRALQAVKSSDSYQIAKTEYAEGFVHNVQNFGIIMQDIYRKIMERIALLETQPIKHLNDKVICDYLNAVRGTVKEYFEMQRTLDSDSGTTISIDIQKQRQEMKAIQLAIRETIIEICPDKQSIFFTTLQSKLQIATQQVQNSKKEEEDDDEDVGGSVKINIKG